MSFRISRGEIEFPGQVTILDLKENQVPTLEKRDIWTTIDNKEFYTEVEALEHEQNLKNQDLEDEAHWWAVKFCENTRGDVSGKGATRVINLACEFYIWLKDQDATNWMQELASVPGDIHEERVAAQVLNDADQQIAQ